jgi:hypothetical protein
MTGFVGDGFVANNPWTFPNEDRAEDPSIVSLGPVIAIVVAITPRRNPLGENNRRPYGVRKILPV